MVIKDFLIKQLPDYIIDRDSYKDLDDKGFIERYLSIFGEELDEYTYNKIGGLLEELDPLTTSKSEFLDYIAIKLGDLPKVTSDDGLYARLLGFIISIYKIKGTIGSYKALLTSLGHKVVSIVEYENYAPTYDADPLIEYDADPLIVYDDSCKPCSDYDVEITTDLPLSGSNYLNVLVCIKILEPISAILKYVIWNGTPVTSALIDIQINSNGDLVYNNDADPDLVITLVEGDLIISGPRADRYYFDGGDLYYTLY